LVNRVQILQKDLDRIGPQEIIRYEQVRRHLNRQAEEGKTPPDSLEGPVTTIDGNRIVTSIASILQPVALDTRVSKAKMISDDLSDPAAAGQPAQPPKRRSSAKCSVTEARQLAVALAYRAGHIPAAISETFGGDETTITNVVADARQRFKEDAAFADWVRCFDLVLTQPSSA
jgi:hypothetical protein